ncbi:MAG: hypothetical protein Q8O67_05955 [Deltaproteobacteria bacterium]|nr:hypothetical protein [Deltaproteobacteria bacterium]
MSPDVDVIDDLVFALLEAAARQLVVSSWPAASPPPKSPDIPAIEASRDAEGALGVFRFATVVDDAAEPRPHFELRLSQARKDGLGEDLKAGDDVGVELPLIVLCAIALANIDSGALPESLAEELASSGLKDAIVARLTLLRGTPPSSPELGELRALVTRHGGDVVRWTMSVQADVDAVPEPLPERLVLALEKEGTARLLVVPAVRGLGARSALLRAIAPTPADDSLWRFLEREGPALLGVDRIVVDVDGAAWGTVTAVDTVSAVPAAGHATRLEVDASALLVSVDDDARARVRAAAAVFQRRLSVRDHGSLARLAGAAVLRVLARAARGTALEARANTELGVQDEEDGSFVVDVHGRLLRLMPADNALSVGVGTSVDAGFFPVAVEGRLIDGDVEAKRCVCAAVADAIGGSEADVELVFVDDDEKEREQFLSAWLRGLGEADVTGWLPCDEQASRAFQDVVDVLLDER